jgi:serine/threonine protein kinase
MVTWVVPGFSEERELGRGASGRVVAAVRDATGDRVAIKYLSPRLFDNVDFLSVFRGEAVLLQALDSPFVVKILEYVEEQWQGAAIVMELIDGVSLHEMIFRQGPTGAEAALVVLKGSLEGLAAAHAAGIVHRDYKPENVLVDKAGQSKLTDFGVAIPAGQGAAGGGTPLYMAPEQWSGGAATPATDIYAATAVFYECLTGKVPFSGPLGKLAELHASAAVPVEQVDEPLRELITRGMAKNPADRPGDAAQFITELAASATAACGDDWEERGRSHLAERAAALLLLLLHGSGSAAGVGAGTSVTTVSTQMSPASATKTTTKSTATKTATKSTTKDPKTTKSLSRAGRTGGRGRVYASVAVAVAVVAAASIAAVALSRGSSGAAPKDAASGAPPGLTFAQEESQGPAIAGTWVLNRTQLNCVASNSCGHAQQPMHVTISCTGNDCTVLRTDFYAAFGPWQTALPLTYSQGAWRAGGVESYDSECGGSPIPGTRVTLVLKVLSGQVRDGVWRAVHLGGTYTNNTPASRCTSMGETDDLSATAP